MTDDVLSRPAPAPDRTLSYGPLPQQVVDVRLPDQTGPRPLVVVVHGGFWKHEYDRMHAGAQSTALAAAGYVVATVEYRRVGPSGGGWPGTLDDAGLFADSVPSLVAEALPGRVDGAPPCFVGHSAGGHLAAWVASRHRLNSGSRWHRPSPLPAVVVSLAGVLDLKLSEYLGLGGHAARALLGGTPEDRPERYAEASPVRLLPSGARTVLVHGADDDVVPPRVSQSYAAAARAAGDDVTLHELAGVGHFELIDPLTPAWPAVLDAVAEALGRPPG